VLPGARDGEVITIGIGDEVRVADKKTPTVGGVIVNATNVCSSQSRDGSAHNGVSGNGELFVLTAQSSADDFVRSDP